MRDYNNMPVLDWSGENVPIKAKTRIMHEEPVILQMPNTSDVSLNGEKFSGRLNTGNGIQFNCNGFRVFVWLAKQNRDPELAVIAVACAYSSSLVNVDAARNRLIVHDWLFRLTRKNTGCQPNVLSAHLNKAQPVNSEKMNPHAT